MSFFPPLTRQKYGWLEASYAAAPATTRRWYHLHGRRPDLDAAYVSRERERKRRTDDGGRGSMVRVALGARGRAAVCTQVMSYKKRARRRERGECYATMSLAVAAVCLLVSPSGAAETGPQRILFCRMDGRSRGEGDTLMILNVQGRDGWKWWGGMLSTTVAVVKGGRAKGRRVGRGARSRCYRAPLAEECIFAVLSRISGSGAGTIK